MDFRELVLKTRSYRRFDQQVPIDRDTLVELVDLARQTPSAANRQPLKYVISCGPLMNRRIFDTLSWAGALPDWPGPGEGERPTGYIVILHDTRVHKAYSHDVGIAAQTILLGAVAAGWGGCMFGAIHRDHLAETLQLPGHMDIVLVVALGRPVEHVVLEEATDGASLKYYRRPDGTHHVPKRSRDEVILGVHAD